MKTTHKKGDRFEVYITKYALSSGVKMCLVESVGTGSVREIMAGVPIYACPFYGPGDWQQTEHGAIERVREMITAKRKSLTKQLARLDVIEKDPLGAAKRDPVYESAEEVFGAHVLGKKTSTRKP